MTPGAAVLAEAFFDDPLMCLFWPDPARRAKALPYFWESRIASRVERGLVRTDHDERGDLACVALWEPEHVESPIAKPFTLVRALGSALPRTLSAVRRMDAARPSTPHLYLAAIGTRPSLRGRGHAGRLLERELETAGAAFLVCTAAVNIPLYERFGFRRGEDLVLDAATTVYPMSR
ncbi:GNAT family N-acetyltransferase [Nocardia bovistercoris]|uniref:GNAT family N-acetyltransferase n=1 Tax=Nocardia bovistercoris TaxID=2785916 RepID=A0A931I630_9NOCA|nr:GNAT family N-acetyltransferase [Nocardia bovistercoris]MBH0774881.1 GNAT family N-acetyltransferase [Nocardia bovistercoris]